jgi:N-acyl homoserine lactone hydrolase
MAKSSRGALGFRVCDRLFCLTLAHEYCPLSVSLEGAGRELVRLPVIGILVHAPAGWVLLETGIDPRHFPAGGGGAGEGMYPQPPDFPTDGDPLIEAMAAHGVAPGDLVAAAVSHLHVDHAGGLHHLAAAGVEVAIQAKELAFGRTRAGRTEAYVRADYAIDGLRWRELDGDAEIVPGIDAVFTPGHAPGHMSYRVRMAQSGTWLFAIDAIDLQRGIDEDTPIGWSADPADEPLRRASHDRLVAMAAHEGARLVPGHCPQTWPTVAHAAGYW